MQTTILAIIIILVSTKLTGKKYVIVGFITQNECYLDR